MYKIRLPTGTTPPPELPAADDGFPDPPGRFSDDDAARRDDG